MSLAYQTFGSHILFKEILDDALGHLYRAAEFDKSGIKRSVFVRVFDGPSVPKGEILAEFEKAGRIGEVLHAANVAANPSFFEANEKPAVAFDFVPSHPLSRVFEKVHEEGFPVPVDNALLISEKLALALSAGLAVDAGGRSLVHGFLHPGLIMVTNDGEGIVSGFGVADQLLSLIDDAGVADSVYPFIAPEVLVTRSASKRADVYSLGAILFQLLTGKPVATMQEEREGMLDRAELAYDERPIPDDIKSLLSKALAARPEERFSSAADFKKELDKLLYGGAYSPTTFNLALFMDRLFRSEIEDEEKQRQHEAAVDHTEYLAPAPEPTPEVVEVAPIPQTKGGGGPNKGVLIGIAAVVIVIAAILFFVLGGKTDEPVVVQATPTPTQEELDAKAAEEEALLVALIETRMAEREAEYRAKMEESQRKVEELQTRLQKSSSSSGMSNEEKQKRLELKRQLAAEQEAIRVREAEAEAARQQELVKAQSATATAVAVAAEAAAAVPTAAPAEPTQAPVDQPPAKPTASPNELVITENMFVEPSQVDSMPVMIKDEKVDWTRLALRSNKKGMVIVQATVNASGKVENVTVLRADEDGFDIPESVIEAVKLYRFKPASKNGVKVKSYATVTKRFNFRGR